MSVSRFLVYALIDPRNNEVRYIGKSSSGMERPRQHCCPNGRRGSTHRERWLNKMWTDDKCVPAIIVLKECLSNEDAITFEMLYIAMFRQSGFRLTNSTDGGDGLCGFVFSDESKEKRRNKMIGRKLSPESIAKRSAARIGKKVKPRSPEHCEKIRQFQTGKRHTDESKMKMRLAKLGRKLTPESIAKRTETQRKNRELRKLISEGHTNKEVADA